MRSRVRRALPEGHIFNSNRRERSIPEPRASMAAVSRLHLSPVTAEHCLGVTYSPPADGSAPSHNGESSYQRHPLRVLLAHRSALPDGNVFLPSPNKRHLTTESVHGGCSPSYCFYLQKAFHALPFCLACRVSLPLSSALPAATAFNFPAPAPVSYKLCKDSCSTVEKDL